MAYIDKIYGTNEQYDEFYAWMKENKPDYLKYFYPHVVQTGKNECLITNFPEHVDRWLLKNCNIDWVIERIKEQYNL